MDDLYDFQESFSYKLVKSETTSVIPSSVRKFQINFNFSFELDVSEWILSEDDESQLVSQSHHPVVDCLVSMSSDQFSSFEESQKYMEEKLTTTSSGLSRLKSSNRRELVDYALREAGKYTAGGGAHRVLNLHFDVLLEHEYIYLRDISNYDESTRHMVPAEDSSIDHALKTVEYSLDIPEMNCSVCLESLSGDDYYREELLSMPCAHIFHGDCIKKWLRTSHYCPLCRFEIPID